MYSPEFPLKPTSLSGLTTSGSWRMLPAFRRLTVVASVALPVLFSGFIFVTLWARSPRKDLAIGSNLLGALVGGIASMLTMLLGFRALTFLTLAVYLMALYVARRAPAASP